MTPALRTVYEQYMHTLAVLICVCRDKEANGAQFTACVTS